MSSCVSLHFKGASALLPIVVCLVTNFGLFNCILEKQQLDTLFYELIEHVTHVSVLMHPVVTSVHWVSPHVTQGIHISAEGNLIPAALP